MINTETYKEKIQNPITGETLYILESNENVFRIEYVIDPRGEIAAEHIHPAQEQTIHVIEGTLGCRINGLTRILTAGQSVVIPPGTPHSQWNPTDLHARAIEEIRPGGKAHSFFRVFFALARDGHTTAKSIPKPLIGAAFIDEFKDFVIVRSIGLRTMFRFVRPISRLLGYQKLVRQYIRDLEREDLDRTPVISFFDTPAAEAAYSRSLSTDTTNR
jgi:quercetin dioxygenase-like cupin family protein